MNGIRILCDTNPLIYLLDGNGYEVKQKHIIKLPDAIIAATAIYLDMPFLTFDKGFKNIPNLKLIMCDW